MRVRACVRFRICIYCIYASLRMPKKTSMDWRHVSKHGVLYCLCVNTNHIYIPTNRLQTHQTFFKFSSHCAFLIAYTDSETAPNQIQVFTIMAFNCLFSQEKSATGIEMLTCIVFSCNYTSSLTHISFSAFSCNNTFSSNHIHIHTGCIPPIHVDLHGKLVADGALGRKHEDQRRERRVSGISGKKKRVRIVGDNRMYSRGNSLVFLHCDEVERCR